MIDAVLSYHMNPQTCGVAKFNQQLAKRLGVPCLPLTSCQRWPLISIKCSELPNRDPYPCFMVREGFDLFLHDWDERYANTAMFARRIYAGNSVIANAIRPLRSDVIEAFCPSTIDGNPTRGAYRVLVFGMAHKLCLPHFKKLKAQLDEEHPDYTIELSTAVHEGNQWDEALRESVAAMRGIFGESLRVLGYLGDDALAKELREVHAVACYFVPALRANNTSYWAAVHAGKTIYTNRDELSPQIDDPPASWDKLVELFRA